jgi:nucleoside-diphosphate-sugar epimerase
MTTVDVQPLGKQKIVITGGAGLVGQNLLVKLRSRGCQNIHVLDKSTHNLAIAAELHESVQFDHADLAEAGSWQEVLTDADIVVMLHAQIGGNIAEDFYRNNVTATRNILSSIPPAALLVHVSSSVIESSANDDYSQSKAQQERLVVESGFDYSVLRPTLMFGWFDRKHFGWLSQFMQAVPIFPIPGDGKYLRQPLYAGDFCDIIIACMEGSGRGESFNISGKEKALYIDIIKLIKAANGSRSVLLKLPYRLFYLLLAIYALFDSDPPFTTGQLKALVIDEVFEDIDWEVFFAVTATPLEQAITQTFTDPKYSKIKLKF